MKYLTFLFLLGWSCSHREGRNLASVNPLECPTGKSMVYYRGQVDGLSEDIRRTGRLVEKTKKAFERKKSGQSLKDGTSIHQLQRRISQLNKDKEDLRELALDCQEKLRTAKN